MAYIVKWWIISLDDIFSHSLPIFVRYKDWSKGMARISRYFCLIMFECTYVIDWETDNCNSSISLIFCSLSLSLSYFPFTISLSNSLSLPDEISTHDKDKHILCPTIFIIMNKSLPFFKVIIIFLIKIAKASWYLKAKKCIDVLYH